MPTVTSAGSTGPMTSNESTGNVGAMLPLCTDMSCQPSSHEDTTNVVSGTSRTMVKVARVALSHPRFVIDTNLQGSRVECELPAQPVGLGGLDGRFRSGGRIVDNYRDASGEVGGQRVV